MVTLRLTNDDLEEPDTHFPVNGIYFINTNQIIVQYQSSCVLTFLTVLHELVHFVFFGSFGQSSYKFNCRFDHVWNRIRYAPDYHKVHIKAKALGDFGKKHYVIKNKKLTLTS